MLNLSNLTINPQTENDLKFDPKWSQMQCDVFRFVAKESGSANVEAVAGSGKTTTILESMKYINSSGEVTFLAFNRSIADELRSRVPAGVKASTFHSLGNAALNKFKKMKLNKRLVSDTLDKNFDDKYKTVFYQARQLVDLARNLGVGLEGEPTFSTEVLYEIADQFDITPRNHKDTDLMLSVARSVMLSTMTNPKREEMDFTDMLYLPLLWNAPFPKSEILYVDEAQDLNSIQHMMLRRALSNNGRIIAVGDTHQAIYGFRGADSSSMGTLRDIFSSQELPLSISYRCPKAVVALAQSLVPHIKSADTAEDGTVTHMDDIPDLSTFTVDDMIICRNNAPLLSLALKMLGQHKPMRFLGDFGDKLISFARSFKTSDIQIFKSRLEEWHENETERLTAQEKWSKLEAVHDKYEAMFIVASSAKTVEDLLTILVKIFEQGNGPIICSIHKSKGLEAKNVFLLFPELIPSKYAQKVAAIQQERNLLYVAYTRARQNLILIHKSIDEE